MSGKIMFVVTERCIFGTKKEAATHIPMCACRIHIMILLFRFKKFQQETKQESPKRKVL